MGDHLIWKSTQHSHSSLDISQCNNHTTKLTKQHQSSTIARCWCIISTSQLPGYKICKIFKLAITNLPAYFNFPKDKKKDMT